MQAGVVLEGHASHQTQLQEDGAASSPRCHQEVALGRGTRHSQALNVEAQGGVYRCTDLALRPSVGTGMAVELVPSSHGQRLIPERGAATGLPAGLCV